MRQLLAITTITASALTGVLALTSPPANAAATDCPGVGDDFRTPVTSTAKLGSFTLISCVDANARQVRGWVKVDGQNDSNPNGGTIFTGGSAEFAYPLTNTTDGPIGRHGIPLTPDRKWHQIGPNETNFSLTQPYVSRAILHVDRLFGGERTPASVRTNATGRY